MNPATPCPRGRISPHRLRQAARLLRAGGVITHATEGVWGLACDPWNRCAVERLLSIKRRDVARGLILIGAQPAHLAVFVAQGADTA